MPLRNVKSFAVFLSRAFNLFVVSYRHQLKTKWGSSFAVVLSKHKLSVVAVDGIEQKKLLIMFWLCIGSFQTWPWTVVSGIHHETSFHVRWCQMTMTTMMIKTHGIAFRDKIMRNCHDVASNWIQVKSGSRDYRDSRGAITIRRATLEKQWAVLSGSWWFPFNFVKSSIISDLNEQLLAAGTKIKNKSNSNFGQVAGLGETTRNGEKWKSDLSQCTSPWRSFALSIRDPRERKRSKLKHIDVQLMRFSLPYSSCTMVLERLWIATRPISQFPFTRDYTLISIRNRVMSLIISHLWFQFRFASSNFRVWSLQGNSIPICGWNFVT